MSTSSSPVLFLSSPRFTASGRVYQGRFVCHDIQWTGSLDDLLGTFTITAEELANIADSGMIWTDQDVQRGIRPEVDDVDRELSLANGYPDPSKYIFDFKNADDIVDKLLYGKKLFLNPLIWNLRPNNFKAYRDNNAHDLIIYEGKIYLPDSHHRQQAIVKAVHLWRDCPKDYPKFSASKQFKVELYFLSRQDEGNFFFDKNQRPRPTAKSKAYDLTTEDDLSILAKKVIEKSSALSGNVNRVTDRLTARNKDLLTLSTLREMMRTFAATDYIDESELDGMAVVAANFFDMLQAIRPELGHLTVSERQRTRNNLLVDAAVMMHGYASLMRSFNLDVGKRGLYGAREIWASKLTRLSANNQYRFRDWQGDIFEKFNPIWAEIGVLKPSRDGQTQTTINTGGTRAECGRVLRQLLNIDAVPSDLSFLAVR